MIRIDIECENVDQLVGELRKLLGEFSKPGKPDRKESQATLETVKQILEAPVKVPETDNLIQNNEKKSQKQEIKSRKREADIQAIKDAVEAKKKVKLDPKAKKSIDTYMIVKMRDESHMTWDAIAKEIGCATQTACNRYNKAKGNAHD